MDLTSISDLNQLKAMAYDQMVILETAQKNMQVINQRIQQVNQEQQAAKEKEAADKALEAQAATKAKKE